MDSDLEIRKKNGALLELWGDTRSSLLETGMSEKFLSCIKVSRICLRLKGEGGISLETLQRKRASSRVEGRISWFFSSCSRKLQLSLELQRGPQGPARVASGKSSLHVSCEGPLGIPLQSVPDPRSSSGAEAATSDFLFRADMVLAGFLWSLHRESCLVLGGDMQVCFPPEL